jgi:hypothetical protein
MAAVARESVLTRTLPVSSTTWVRRVLTSSTCVCSSSSIGCSARSVRISSASETAISRAETSKIWPSEV